MEVRRMRISCRRCQVRKLKCTRVHPCGNCVGSDSECTFRDDDTRRRPVSRSYVVALEERLASYEAMLRNPQLRSPEWRQAMLSTAVEENPSASSSAQAIPTSPVFDYSGSSRLSTLTLQPGPQGSLSFYGPTSIYQKDCITARCVGSSQSPPNRRFELWQDFRLSRTLNVQEATINRSLSRFFRFLSAECLFIHHDTFLEDFFGQVHNNKYWSYPLLYSLSSLGARLGPGQGDLQDADSLARCSHEMASIGYLETPHTTVVQTLLALAFVELGNGHHVKGWMLSGMAFRMGQDIGLHQDPRFLIHDDSTITFTDDFSLRRRVYWGCYVADKMISLYLGRPMMLHEADAAVDPLDQLYRTESLDAELSIVPELDHFLPDVPDGKITLTVFIHQVELSKIIESVLSLLFSAKFIKTPRKELVIDRLARAEELSVRLYKWHSSLPESLAWSQWTPTKHSLSPQAAAIHALYHSTLISLNRHFIRPTPGFARRNQSREICMASAESIMAIIRQYRMQYSLRNAPLTLVYSAVMAATAISFSLGTASQGHTPTAEFETHMKSLLKSLNELSVVYRVAQDASARLEATLRQGQKAKTGAGENISPDINEGGQITTSLFEFGWFGIDTCDPQESMPSRMFWDATDTLVPDEQSNV